ncbi:MAG: anthranilate synthase component I family protein, partial [Vulcanococcus sp.]
MAAGATLQRRPLAWRDPAAVAAALAADWGPDGLIWLDGDGTNLGRWLTLAADPLEQHACRGLPGQPGASDPFAQLAQLGPGHWCGWLSYEAAAWVEPADHWKADALASLWIARHDPVLRFDLQKRELWIEGQDPVRLEAMARWLETRPGVPEPQPGPALPVELWHWHSDSRAFATGVERLQELIAAGDLFQANLTACCSTTLPAG